MYYFDFQGRLVIEFRLILTKNQQKSSFSARNLQFLLIFSKKIFRKIFQRSGGLKIFKKFFRAFLVGAKINFFLKNFLDFSKILENFKICLYPRNRQKFQTSDRNCDQRSQTNTYAATGRINCNSSNCKISTYAATGRNKAIFDRKLVHMRPLGPQFGILQTCLQQGLCDRVTHVLLFSSHGARF